MRLVLLTPRGERTVEIAPPAEMLTLGEFCAVALEIHQQLDRDSRTEGPDIPQPSCRAGCGACCRQLVCISPAEAFYLEELIESASQPEGEAWRLLFTRAGVRIAAAGLAERLARINDPAMTEAEHFDLARDYFRLGLACPFLSGESCGIHPLRPLLCREYLVSSPAEWCGDPFERTPSAIPPPAPLAHALANLSAAMLRADYALVPLPLAPAFAREHAEQSARRWPAARLLEELALHLDVIVTAMG